MKNEIISFPVFAGSVSVCGKDACMCKVTSKGKMFLQSEKLNKTIIKHKNILFLRGIEFFLFATFYFFYFLRKSFVLSNQNIVFKTSSQKWVNNYGFWILVFALGCMLGVVLLGALPTSLGFIIFKGNYSVFVKKLCIAVVKCLVFYSFLLVVKFLPSIVQFFKFNCANNYAVNHYLTIQNKNNKDYEKYSSILPTNYFNVLIFSLLLDYFVVCLIGFNLELGWKLLVNLGFLLLSFSIVYEIMLAFQNKFSQSKKLLWFLNLLTISTPTKTELQVANTSLNEALLMNDNQQRKLIELTTDNSVAFSYVLADVKEQFLKSGINDKDEAEWLIATYLGCSKLDIRFMSDITKTQQKDIQKLVERRIKGEPIAKIFEFTEFYGLDFKVNQYVLTPRQETEILVEKVLEFVKDKKFKILDLCTGSGAIAVTVAKNTQAQVFASDISEDALKVAKFNADKHKVKVTFKQSDLFSKISAKKFDIIISNPPYIKTNDILELDKEVKNYDPIIALDGGNDGLYFYRKIAELSPNYLSKNGMLFLEVGAEQANKVKKLLTEEFTNIKIVKDYNQIQRVVIAQKK